MGGERVLDDRDCGKANGAKRSLENPGGGYIDLPCRLFSFAESLKLFITTCWEIRILVIFFKTVFIGQACQLQTLNHQHALPKPCWFVFFLLFLFLSLWSQRFQIPVPMLLPLGEFPWPSSLIWTSLPCVPRAPLVSFFCHRIYYPALWSFTNLSESLDLEFLESKTREVSGTLLVQVRKQQQQQQQWVD